MLAVSEFLIQLIGEALRRFRLVFRSTQSIKAENLFLRPFEQRAILHLVYASRYSRQEVADIMNISCECGDQLLGYVRLRLRR